MTLAVPSTDFKKIFPVYPSLTKTSISPYKGSRASIFPLKLIDLQSFKSGYASFETGEPFSSSVPLESKYTLGFSS